jgi:hypothetical protein
MGLYETWGKMKHEFNFLMKRSFNLFLLKNNMSVSLCPRRFIVSNSPILPYTTYKYIQTCSLILLMS